ncbi:hypothetical protein ACSTKO_08865 [Vibrio parahaemolyticus]|uniref:hypothetical protein n=1 Tax=unclassified Vibrio TaxID=2614977 RepID=UPI00202AD673|nr:MULTISPECIES: hypothetical protein [unclassified Vibrio]ELN6883741.1 hypothetical protein [Vibrio alginolyticus]MDG2603101.1 hypothetical protein [Vibrio parahaemolyticus]MDW3166405.1 hypothetical protein [Vibrio sp. Y184]URQ96801.1 hypothetical protein J4N40_16955 [Vibrio sp. SCSIO 43097]HBN6272922.1 hypothetical protein [Vibrio parahaemolyticus]
MNILYVGDWSLMTIILFGFSFFSSRIYSGQSAHDAGIPSLSRGLERATGSIRRNIRIHETVNQEIGTSIEHARDLAERQSNSYLQLSRAFEVIDSAPRLRDELKSRLIRNKAHKTPCVKKDSLRRILKKIKAATRVRLRGVGSISCIEMMTTESLLVD